MPTYDIQCKKCKKLFEHLCSLAEFDAGFPNTRCPECNSKRVKKVFSNNVPGAVFNNPRESSKWDNWSYRQGKTAEEAKQCRSNAEAANKGRLPYKNIDDTDRGKKMNFID